MFIVIEKTQRHDERAIAAELKRVERVQEEREDKFVMKFGAINEDRTDITIELFGFEANGLTKTLDAMLKNGNLARVAKGTPKDDGGELVQVYSDWQTYFSNR